ncbi:hypothetical protein AMS58_05135 [Pseudoalteromonas porphyrae]|uniref:TonB-dependent siderophore receptor n=1 Tax=Pseudoalteromonas TaxID=53246 RepID=UPI0006BAA1A5|nr:MULTISPECIES: TonB-dependent siderophore receptor [Pseudoalteromonas]KPH95581.1 hypothetical protein AMS58_05135 [Pseudoalteromonas porphyrae]
MKQFSKVAQAVGLGIFVGVTGIAYADDVSKVDAQELEKITVLGKHYRNIGATGLPLAIGDTPQAISLIDAEYIALYDLNSVGDALEHSAAIHTDPSPSGRDRFAYSRGFAMNRYLVDGMVSAGRTFQSSLLDASMFETVEVIRGSTGMLQEVGQPSGTVNLIQKRAQESFSGYVNAELGSWGKRRVEGDVTGALTSDGSVKARAVAVYENADSFQDRVNSARKVIYGTISAELTDDFSASVFWSQQEDELDEYSGGLPFSYNDGSVFHGDIGHNDNPSWVYEDANQDNVMVELQYSLNDDWSIQGRYHRSDVESDGIYFSADSLPDVESGLYYSYFNHSDRDHESERAELNLTGNFTLLAREHNVTFSVADASFTEVETRSFSQDSPDINANDPSSSVSIPKPVFSDPSITNSEQESKNYRIAANLNVAEPINILLGANYKDIDSRAGAGHVLSDWVNNSDTSLYIGATYDVTEAVSVYSSYTDIFELQMVFDKNGDLLDPTVGKNKEIGARYSSLDGNLNIDVALFKINQENFAITDTSAAAARIYKSVDGVESKGYEIEISGYINDQWRASIAYSNLSLSDNNEGRISKIVPDKVAKFNTDYEFDGLFAGLTLGGFINWTGERHGFIANPDWSFHYPELSAYTVIGLVANYEVTDNLSVKANINNAFDKEYEGKVSWFSSRPGTPRNYSVQLNYRF